MDDKHLYNSTWDCKYHLVFAGKYSMNRVYGELRRELGEKFRRLSVQKGCEIVEGHLMSDHVHILISIPPKYSVAYIAGFLKGKATYGCRRIAALINRELKEDGAAPVSQSRTWRRSSSMEPGP